MCARFFCEWGLPGALPVLNRHAVELAIEAALAPTARSIPVDLSEGRTISTRICQRGLPNLTVRSTLGGASTVSSSDADGVAKRIGVTLGPHAKTCRKSIHDCFRIPIVILRRSQSKGTPLDRDRQREPDMRASAEAYAYLPEIKQVMQYLNVSRAHGEGPFARGRPT